MENNETPQEPRLPADIPAEQTPATSTPPPTSPPPRHPLRESFRKAIGTSEELTPQQQINRRTFVSFASFFVLGAVAWKAWFFIKDAVPSDGVQGPLRKVLDADDKFFSHTLSPGHLAPTFPKTAA
ncbi:MAG TPA: hypothetical protein VGR89_09820, partial [Puia sp.]|nr:hypothetical protein [Puia sp.]